MISCRTSIEHWAMTEPFEIAREVITDLPVLVLSLTDAHGHAGRAEAAGVDYDGETPQTMAIQIAAVAILDVVPIVSGSLVDEVLRIALDVRVNMARKAAEAALET
jgi:hypothetical protein